MCSEGYEFIPVIEENVIEEFLETGRTGRVRLAQLSVPEFILLVKSGLYREILKLFVNGGSSAPPVTGMDSKGFTEELRIFHG